MEKKTIADTKFWKFVNLAGNAIGLNLIFLVCCLPVVTIGPALCGLYSGVRYLIREDGWWGGFWKGFTTHWLRSAILGVLVVAFQAYTLWQFNLALGFYLESGSIYYAILYGIMALIPALLTASLWPLNIYIPYSTADWLRASVSLVFSDPIPVLLASGLFLLPVVLALFLTQWAYYGLIIILAVYFALAAFVATLFYKDSLVVLLKAYRAEHPEDEDHQA